MSFIYEVSGGELLGNELSGVGIGTRVAADQYASDTDNLERIVQKIYTVEIPRPLWKPLVIAPGGFFEANWFTEFINKSSQSVEVVSHHIYNLGPGIVNCRFDSNRISIYIWLNISCFNLGSDSNLVNKILDPKYLDNTGRQPFRDLQGILASSESSAMAWVGEAGGAYNSGRHLVSNAFVYSFW